MTHNITNYRPLNNDLIVTLADRKEATSSCLIIKENPDTFDTQFVEIVKAGDKCKHVKVGDIVLVKWSDMTSPFDLPDENNLPRQYAITDESKLLAVLEEE